LAKARPVTISDECSVSIEFLCKDKRLNMWSVTLFYNISKTSKRSLNVINIRICTIGEYWNQRNNIIGANDQMN
jgi:hypothetical protein